MAKPGKISGGKKLQRHKQYDDNDEQETDFYNNNKLYYRGVDKITLMLSSGKGESTEPPPLATEKNHRDI